MERTLSLVHAWFSSGIACGQNKVRKKSRFALYTVPEQAQVGHKSDPITKPEQFSSQAAGGQWLFTGMAQKFSENLLEPAEMTLSYVGSVKMHNYVGNICSQCKCCTDHCDKGRWPREGLCIWTFSTCLHSYNRVADQGHLSVVDRGFPLVLYVFDSYYCYRWNQIQRGNH